MYNKIVADELRPYQKWCLDVCDNGNNTVDALTIWEKSKPSDLAYMFPCFIDYYKFIKTKDTDIMINQFIIDLISIRERALTVENMFFIEDIIIKYRDGLYKVDSKK